MKKQIYLDSQATTPVDQDVLETMLPYFTRHYGNGNHKAGWKTSEAVENARHQVSSLLGARPSEITFASGATEAINLALLGLAKRAPKHKNHIVTQPTEHKAVLQCIDHLRKKRYKISMLEVDSVGRICLESLKKEITENTLLVAIMLANNEIGTVQPVKKIGNLCKENKATFFCDITQGLGWYPINMKELNIDMAAFSGHKIYGPLGAGGLYIRKTKPRFDLEPLLFGGAQEKGLRPGTVNVPAIVGLGKACELLSGSEEIYGYIKELRDDLKEQLFRSIDGLKLNGCPDNRHPGNLNIAIPSISSDQLKQLLPNVLFSTTSACSSLSSKPSHVLSALTKDKNILKNSFRIGINKYNTKEEIDFVARKMIKIASAYNLMRL